MIRYAFILLAAMGAVATAAAFQDAPAGTPGANVHPVIVNQTIVAKNSAFPVIGPESWVQCKTADCSDVPNE